MKTLGILRSRWWLLLLVPLSGVLGIWAVYGTADREKSDTLVVMLGTGTPVPNYARAGSGVAVVYKGRAYLFDVGGGVVKRCMEAWQAKGIEALNPTRIQHLFITHMHSDHVLDYAELANTFWWRRDSQIHVYGPVGIETMAQGYYRLMQPSIHHRIHGKQPVAHPTYYQTIQHEYAEGGWTFVDGEVTVEAFEMAHGDMKPSFGYRVTTPDKTIAISGDTAKTEQIFRLAKDADILIHEVITDAGLALVSDFWQQYHKSYHTRTEELAEIANKIKPDILVLTHVLHYGAPVSSALTEIKKHYKGKVLLASDLDIIE